MARLSAGLVLWRRSPMHRPAAAMPAGAAVPAGSDIEVLIGHMGGPFWARRDHGAWSIPKGEYDPDEDPFDAAVREFREELGHEAPVPFASAWTDLGEFAQSSKRIRVWAREGDLDASACVSNTFVMEWPRGSGVECSFPELDRVEWTAVPVARERVVKGQIAVLDALVQHAG